MSDLKSLLVGFIAGAYVVALIFRELAMLGGWTL
jgi:hypothetical protein